MLDAVHIAHMVSTKNKKQVECGTLVVDHLKSNKRNQSRRIWYWIIKCIQGTTLTCLKPD